MCSSTRCTLHFLHLFTAQQCEAHWMSTLCCVFHNRGVIVGSRRRWRYCPCTVHSAHCTKQTCITNHTPWGSFCTVHKAQCTVQMCITTRKLVHNVYSSGKKAGHERKSHVGRNRSFQPTRVFSWKSDLPESCHAQNAKCISDSSSLILNAIGKTQK